MLSRVFRLIWGDDVERALRPVLAVSLMGSIAGSTIFPFLGIWAIKELHASQRALGFTYLCGAVGAGLVGYLSGHASDRIGRRPLILLGWGASATVPIAVLLVGDRVALGLTLLGLLPALSSLGGAATQAMVTDVSAPERSAYGDATMWMCVAVLGVTAGISGAVAARGRDSEAAIASPA